MGNSNSNFKTVMDMQEQLDYLVDKYDQLYSSSESVKHDLKKSNDTIKNILDLNNVNSFLEKNQNDMLEDQFEIHYITKYQKYLINKYSLSEKIAFVKPK